jgi:hypothetical protein
MIPAELGIAILILAGLWLFAGLLARACGALLMLAGAVGVAVTGNVSGFVVVMLGAALSLAGHWHYALRHGRFKSALASMLASVLRRGMRSTNDRGWHA